MVSERISYIEYSITAACIFTSLVISLWIGKKGSKTVSNYVLGNGKMPLWAITTSHIASSVSSITMIANPAEAYYFGTITTIYYIGVFIMMALLQSYVFLPVLYKLQLGSLFEYCELRFSKNVRYLVSAINMIYELSQISIMIYAVSVVISQVGGISSGVSATGLMAVCVLYTSLGGFTGVVYTDSFQVIIIVCSLIVLLALSYINSGGVYSIIDAISNGDLFEYSTMKWDARLNVWTVLIGNSLNTAMYFTGSAAYQRAISLPSLRKAQKANLIGLLGHAIICTSTSILGLALHAVFQRCDPYNAMLTTKLDQIVPYFVLSYGTAIPGIVGLFTSGIVCAALSTTAIYLNNSTAVVYKDFIQQRFKRGQSDVAARLTMQILCVVLGLTCWCIALLLRKTNSIQYLWFSLVGVPSSTIFTVFIIGMFLPRVNSKAVLSALIPWLGVMVLLFVNMATNPKPSYPTKNKRVDGCPFNVTAVQNSSIPIDPKIWNELSPIHRLPNTAYSSIAILFIIVVSIVASFWTKKGDEEVDPALLSHLIQRRQRTETNEPNVDIPLILQTAAINHL